MVDLKGVVGNHVQDKTLAEVLSKASWDVGQAVDVWFEKGYAEKYVPKASSCSEKNIQELFNQYSSDKGKTMDMDSIISFFTELKVDLEDPVTLLISYKM